MYKYPPAAAVLEMPLSFLPLPAAKVAIYALSCAATLAAFALSLRLLPERGPGDGRVVLVTVLVLGRYFGRELSLGQINVFLAVMMLLVLVRLSGTAAGDDRGAQRCAGALWGASAIPKPYALVFAPYWLVTGRWRVVVGGVVVATVVSCSPALFYGWQGNLDMHRAWLASLARSTPSLLAHRANVSLLSLFAKWSGDLHGARMMLVPSVLALAALVLLVVRAGRAVPRPIALDGGLLMMLIPVLSPLGWDYLGLFSILAVMLLVHHRDRLPPAWRVVLTANLVAFVLPWVVGPLHELYLRGSVECLLTLVNAGVLARLRFQGTC
jgi:hypothetical protein